MRFSYRLLPLMGAGLALTACTTSQNIDPIDISGTVSPQQEQSITITELLGIPETSIRPPANSPIVPVNAHQVLKEGLFAFYDANESAIHEIKSSGKNHELTGILGAHHKRVFSWSYGSSTLFRNSKAVTDWGKVYSSPVGKDAVKIHSASFPNLNFKAQLIAYDISGKIVREFMRDSNNQLDDLAFSAPGHVVFPEGSRAYHVVYTLSNDEIVRPAANAFTGAQTLEKLRDKFSSLINPFCMNYINLEDSKAYGILFDSSLSKKLTLKKQKAPTEGTYQLIDTNKDSIFCQYLGTKTIHKGKWRVRTVQGTRVLELDIPANIAPQNFGIQPINENAIRVAFAEIYPDSATKKNAKTQVVPVRVIRKNEPVIDFRLKFNETAAQAMRETLRAAKRAPK